MITIISVGRPYGRKANEESMSERSGRERWTRVGREACTGKTGRKAPCDGRSPRVTASLPIPHVSPTPIMLTQLNLLAFTSQQSTSRPPPTPLSQIHPWKLPAISEQFACSQSQMQARFHQNSSAVGDRRLPRDPSTFNRD